MQALYEAKWLTYPRTDSEYLTKQEFDYLAVNLDQYQELLPEKWLYHRPRRKSAMSMVKSDGTPRDYYDESGA